MMNLCMPLLDFKEDYIDWSNKFYSWGQDCIYIGVRTENTSNTGVFIGKFKYKNNQDYPIVYMYTGEHGQRGEPDLCDNSDDNNAFYNKLEIYQWGNKNRKIIYHLPSILNSDIYQFYIKTFGNAGKTTRHVFLHLEDAKTICRSYFDPELLIYNINVTKQLKFVSPSPTYGFFQNFYTCQNNTNLDTYFPYLGYPYDIYKYSIYGYSIGNKHLDTHGYTWSGYLGIELAYSG